MVRATKVLLLIFMRVIIRMLYFDKGCFKGAIN